MAGRTAGEERRDDLPKQFLPDGAIAKEARHAYQQLLEKQIQFLRVFLQIPNVGGNPVNLVDAHAAFDPAIEGIFLVERKVMAGMSPQQDDRFLQGALRLVVFRRQFGGVSQRSALQVGHDSPWQVVHGGRMYLVGGE